MRKRLNIMRNSARKFRRVPFLLLAIAVTAIVAIAGVKVISSQRAAVKEESGSQVSTPLVTRTAPMSSAPTNKTYVTVKVAGQDVQVDSQTGQIKELTPEEARKLAAGLRQEINQSTEDLVQTQHPDGSVSMDLEGHFQDVIVARKTDNGTVVSCVDNPKSAGAFFGIDPQLIDRKVSTQATQNRGIKPKAPLTPAKKEIQ